MPKHYPFTKIAEVESIERLPNSRNGNPRFRIRFTDRLEGITKTDAGWAYAIHDGMKTVTIRYHYTPGGRCIIDDVLEGSYTPAEGHNA